MILDGNSKISNPKVYANEREMELENQLAQKDKIIEKLKELYAYESINEKDDLEDFEVETVVHLSAINRKNSQTIISKSISSKNGKLARKIKKEVEELENEQ